MPDVHDTRKQLDETKSSLDITSDSVKIARLEALVPASQLAGTRYPAAAMAMLDNER